MKKLVVLAVLFSLFVLSCTAYAGYPMKIKDARGKEITFKAVPKRIVSLAPGNTEILFALGLKNQIVGVTKYCNYPPEAKKKPKIGDMNVSAEAVVALKPDLVLAQATMNDTVIPKLEKLGLKVFAIDPKTINEVIRDILTVGKITNTSKAAEKIAKSMKSTVKSVTESSLRRGAPRAMVVIQSNPLWLPGPNTFLYEIINILNVKNVGFDAKPGFAMFSKETAISRNPEVIFVGLKSDVDYFMKSPEWAGTDAVKNKDIYIVNNDILVRPGPRLMVGMKEMAKKLEPKK